ncbi:MAG: signal recognition particle-docking protein FtsY [Candidatus Woesearchaeota archaeon]
MFGFLKKKIQEAINSFKKVDATEENIDQKDKKEQEKELKKDIEKKEKKQETEKKETRIIEHRNLEKEFKEKTFIETKENKEKESQNEDLKKVHQEQKKVKLEQTKATKETLKEEFKEKEKQKKQQREIEKKIQEKDIQEQEKQQKKGIFDKIGEFFSTTTISEQKFEEIFYDLEIGLLENNVALEVIDKIKQDLKTELVNKKLPKGNIDKKVIDALKNSIESLFDVDQINLVEKIKEKKQKTGNPYIILMIGINGSGKTTTIAKLVNLFKKNNLTCVIGACDTFRAAAIQQLEEHANKLNVKLIKHDYGSDPAAVAFDTVQHAKAKNIDVVLIDTAGRLHSNANLMAELEKIIRVVKPDFKLFIGESIAGNDVVEQVKLFNEKSGIDGIILSKADIDEKGGAAISVSYITGKPILYLGIGQNYDDLIEFNKEKIIEQIF